MSEKNAPAVRWEVLPDPAHSTERIAAGLLAVNRDTAGYGLVLSPAEAHELAEVRAHELADTRRVEFGESVLPDLARGFAASPYVGRQSWYETLERLVGIFFFFFFYTYDRIGDAELIALMREAFDGPAHGSVDLLEARELDILARRLRAGYSAGVDELDEILPDDEYDEGEDDGFTATCRLM